MGKLKMIHYKTYLLILFTAFCTLSVFADDKLAIINDPDGFTNVRSGQGNDFSIVATIEKDEFFYCDLTTNQEWVRIIALKWKESRQVEGYIHKSRIQLVERLDIHKQKELLTQILNNQKRLAGNFQKAHKSKDSLSYKTAVRELELYSEIKYSPILDILPQYFCSTNDTIILQLFYATMWADKGSANEMPSFSIGNCFICNPALVIEQLLKIKDVEHKKLLFEQIEWGLLNHFNDDENAKSDDKEFYKLKARLDNERKKAIP